MKKSLFRLVSLGLLTACALAAPIPLYENYGAVTNVPQINATAFANYGIFNVTQTILPYDTQNTLYYTNRGTMVNTPGFSFEHVTDSGFRFPASQFVNFAGASVLGGSFAGGLVPVPGGGLENPAILVSATNVINRGFLTVGAAGVLKLTGQNLDLSRGGLQVEPAFAVCPAFVVNAPQFTPDLGVFDTYWGAGNQTFFLAALGFNAFDPFTASISAPAHNANTPVLGGFPPNNCYGNLRTALGLPFADASVFTTAVTPTNLIVQVAFVQNQFSDPPIFNSIGFAPSTIATNPFVTPVIGLQTFLTNVVTGGLDLQEVYLQDTLTSETNQGLLTNLESAQREACPTMMPGNYALGRGVCFPATLAANATLTPTIFFQPTMSVTNLDVPNPGDQTVITTFTFTNRVTAGYAAYGAAITNLVVRVPIVPDVTVSNLPGKVEIDADVLDLNRTRIRGEGNININTRHLIGSTNAAIDSENLLFNLASTNGNLVVQDLTKLQVERFYGTINAWSAVWTNQLIELTEVFTNNIDTNTMMTNLVSAGTTSNVTEIVYHVSLLAGFMNTIKPVQVRRMEVHSTNIVINDTMNVTDRLLLDGESFTLNGNVTLSGFSSGPGATVAIDWNSSAVPQLKYFTNNGVLNIANRGWFGNDRPDPYTRFVNRGIVSTISHNIRAEEFENTGTLLSVSDQIIEARAGKFEGGQVTAGTDITIRGGDFKFNGGSLQPGNALFLAVTNSLTDTGTGVNTLFNCQRGFNLTVKPQFGALFDATFSTRALLFESAVHTWAAEDRGATDAGFTDNAAIGRLQLNADLFGVLSFAGTGASNALYVDRIEFQGSVLTAFNAGNLGSVMEVAPNLIIYFADASVPVEQLDGQLGGRLRWARDFTGPLSSVDVLLLNGKTVRMNRGLRNSVTIDSDGDGVANGFDFYPLDAAVWVNLSLTGGPAPMARVSFTASPLTVYEVQFTTNLSSPDWQPLSRYTNDSVLNNPISILDTNFNLLDGQRFYRLLLVP